MLAPIVMLPCTTTPSPRTCSRAVSVYAMQKTGSTFLAQFLRDVAAHRKMCRTYQNNKEFLCQSTLWIDCPRNSRHRKTVSLERSFSTQLPSSETGRRCNDHLKQRLLNDGNDWLRSDFVTTRYRYNQSMKWLLSSHGFVRGPLRQLYTEVALNAVPFYPDYHNVIIVHTRHPVEMMVSSFYCIADPQVCPKRIVHLGSHVPKNDTISSLDAFVMVGLGRQGSTPHSILQRNLAISRFIKKFESSSLRQANSMGCPAATLVHSKYETMVTNFSSWADTILKYTIGRPRKNLHAALVKQYSDDFVPNGQHKHALVKGANIAKLRASTIRALRSNAPLSTLLQALGYDWLGH